MLSAGICARIELNLQTHRWCQGTVWEKNKPHFKNIVRILVINGCYGKSPLHDFLTQNKVE